MMNYEERERKEITSKFDLTDSEFETLERLVEIHGWEAEEAMEIRTVEDFKKFERCVVWYNTNEFTEAGIEYKRKSDKGFDFDKCNEKYNTNFDDNYEGYVVIFHHQGEGLNSDYPIEYFTKLREEEDWYVEDRIDYYEPNNEPTEDELWGW